MTTPAAYREWQQAAWELLQPLTELMRPGLSELPLEGQASDHDANADRLEAFARPCLLAAFWLASSPEEQDEAEKIARWFREALALGTDPSKPEHYWGPNANYHQNGVEMGLFAIALEVAKPFLWEPLDEEAKQRVIRWMASNRGTGHHWNNHFYFGVFALEFLESVGAGRASDRQAIDHWFQEMELMYRGRGWFMDGMNQSYDHYNAYAFHFYGPMWAHLYGHRNPVRAKRWCDWSREFLTSYQHVFAASGEHPAFGRSITYRFNASAAFAAAQLVDATELSPGRCRRLCTRNLRFFLDRETRQGQGALSIGWHDTFPGVSEPYSCAGSVYWAAKAFVALLVPREHAFWQEPEQPLVAELEDAVHVVDPAGLIFRTHEGAAEILNAGSEICAGNRDKFGPYKWGKLAYRTDFGFCVAERGGYSPDLGLTGVDPRDGRRFGRHYTVPLEMGRSHYLSSYNLGDRELQANVSVETFVAWKGGWLLQVHRYTAYQPMEFTLGGYALPLKQPQAAQSLKQPFLQASGEGRVVALQPLQAHLQAASNSRLEDAAPRRHLQAPYHITPLLTAPAEADEGWLAALCFAGYGDSVQPWEVVSLAAGEWTLQHPQLGPWTLRHAWLPALD
ncbi:MAG: DUF2264 domain-containing protein [Verrucomicrobiota bacterium JB022]|nr:DUF2264 domain-containing protein [Verrucomicrobiota bacterium JB022]